jgi:hypothetical protein
MESIEEKSVTMGTDVNRWRIGLNGGDRAYYREDWLLRAGVALAGIYANDVAEALYPITHTDGTGAKLDGSTSRYTITFPDGQLPPVNSFWSVTMYDEKTQLLVDNPINRYLINSPMLPSLKKNGDGSLTLYIQKDSPDTGKEANWLPAPNDTFYLVLRLYWPKHAGLDGGWKPPAVQPCDGDRTDRAFGRAVETFGYAPVGDPASQQPARKTNVSLIELPFLTSSPTPLGTFRSIPSSRPQTRTQVLRAWDAAVIWDRCIALTIAVSSCMQPGADVFSNCTWGRRDRA